jgi:hypothetical protein
MGQRSYTCAYCGKGVEGIERASSGNGESKLWWLQCPSCMGPTVRTREGVYHPAAPAGGHVPGLPDDVQRAWTEVRAAFSVGAYTASEMMCRKILMHIAVGKTPMTDGKNFVAYVDALDQAGFVTPGLKPAVDLIRQRGNTANHEIPASSPEAANTTLVVTEHLLRSVYEMPTLVP